jgi:hypothetical protein
MSDAQSTSLAAKPAGRSRSTWMRFGLRSFFVLLTVLAVGCAWLGWQVRRAKLEDRVITTLRSSTDGHTFNVSYDSYFRPGDGPGVPDILPFGPPRHTWLLGTDIYRSVSLLQCTPTAGNTFSAFVKEENGKRVRGMNRQYNCGCRDADLVEIAKLSNLRWLLLDANPVTDKGLESLTALQKLEHLGLEHTLVTDEGVRSIATLPRLQTLNLSRTDITSECVEILGQCKQLKELDVSQTHLEDKDVARLRKLLPNCEVKK